MNGVGVTHGSRIPWYVAGEDAESRGIIFRGIVFASSLFSEAMRAMRKLICLLVVLGSLERYYHPNGVGLTHYALRIMRRRAFKSICFSLSFLCPVGSKPATADFPVHRGTGLYSISVAQGVRIMSARYKLSSYLLSWPGTPSFLLLMSG